MADGATWVLAISRLPEPEMVMLPAAPDSGTAEPSPVALMGRSIVFAPTRTMFRLMSLPLSMPHRVVG